MSTEREQGPRWLDDAEMDTWLAFAPMLVRLPLELDRQLQRDSDVSLIEYHVLAGLSAQEDRSLRMSTLARWAGAQLPRMSQVASRMEARGWIVRRPDPQDRRTTLATLTDAGFAVLRAAAPGHVAAVRRLVLDPLTSAQVRHLGAISERVLHVIDPDDAERPRRSPRH